MELTEQQKARLEVLNPLAELAHQRETFQGFGKPPAHQRETFQRFGKLLAHQRETFQGFGKPLARQRETFQGFGKLLALSNLLHPDSSEMV